MPQDPAAGHRTAVRRARPRPGTEAIMKAKMPDRARGAAIMAPVLLLAFDTATPAVTVALTDGTALLAEHTEVDARRHGELLAPGIAAVLQAAGRSRTELTDVAVGVGP